MVFTTGCCSTEAKDGNLSCPETASNLRPLDETLPEGPHSSNLPHQVHLRLHLYGMAPSKQIDFSQGLRELRCLQRLKSAYRYLHRRGEHLHSTRPNIHMQARPMPSTHPRPISGEALNPLSMAAQRMRSIKAHHPPRSTMRKTDSTSGKVRPKRRALWISFAVDESPLSAELGHLIYDYDFMMVYLGLLFLTRTFF